MKVLEPTILFFSRCNVNLAVFEITSLTLLSKSPGISNKILFNPTFCIDNSLLPRKSTLDLTISTAFKVISDNDLLKLCLEKI